MDGNKINAATGITGNNIKGNEYIRESKIYPDLSEVVSKVYEEKNVTVPESIYLKPGKRGKRLNTFDNNYLPDRDTEINEEIPLEENIFEDKKKNNIDEKIKKIANFFFEKTEPVNCFYLKAKERDIKDTVNRLSSINRNTNDLITEITPYGEENTTYEEIAKNLNRAAKLINESDKKFGN